MTLEEYKKKAEGFLENELNYTAAAVKDLMRSREPLFKTYMQDGLTHEETACAISMNLL